jgi:hypothetical protein
MPNAHEKRPDQPARRHGDQVDVAERRAGSKRLPDHHRRDELEMPPRRAGLEDDAPP